MYLLFSTERRLTLPFHFNVLWLMCSCLFSTDWRKKKKSLEIHRPGFTFGMKIALLEILYLKIGWNRLSLLFSSTPQPKGKEIRSALCSHFFYWLYFCLNLILYVCVYKTGTLLAERNFEKHYDIHYYCLVHCVEWPSLGTKEKGKDWTWGKRMVVILPPGCILEVSRSTEWSRQTTDKNNLSK